jgi:hypothetical protein
MKTKILFALFMSLVFLATNNASAYYCPATGRWLSRDPMGEPGFETLRAADVVPEVGQIASTASLPPSRLANRDPIVEKKTPNLYGFVNNSPVDLFDIQGLNFGDGKICGNYCGGGYCGGKHLKPGEKCDYSVPATDALDTCCKAHDMCYDDVAAGKTTKAACDATLCACSKAAKKGPNDKCGCIARQTVPFWACHLAP